MIQDVDVSWPQKSYHPGAESGVIIAATSGDTASGALFTQSTFVEDVGNARAAGKEVGFYHFNGGTDPVGSARYFWSVIAPYFRSGDIVILDVESWQGGTRPAWTPAQATAFANELARLRALTTEQSRLGIYGNRSDMRAPGWGALERAGSWLFLASPGGYPENTPVGEWSHWTMLQYSSAGGVDRDESESTFAQIVGTPLEALMALKDTLEIFQSPRGYFIAGPGFVYDVGDKDGVTGTDKLAALGKIGVPTTVLDQGTYDILRIVLRGNDLTSPTAQTVEAIHGIVAQPIVRDGVNVSQADDAAATGTLVRHIVTTGVPVDASSVASAFTNLPQAPATRQDVTEVIGSLKLAATA